MNKNLVYFCVFGNNDYVELLRILMTTVKLYSSTETIDFLVLTNKDLEPLIQDISNTLNIPIHMKFYDINGADLDLAIRSCYARYYIFDYENINQYDTILYLDTDIIVQNELTTLFNLTIEDRIYAMSEGTIEHEYHGGWFFDFNTIDKNTVGMNGGILLFKNTDKTKILFNDITIQINDLRASGRGMPGPGDQPFLNYQCISRGGQDTTLLDNYGLIYCTHPPPPPSAPTDIILCHFVWPIGNAIHKKNRMTSHVTHLLNHYTNLLKEPKIFSIPTILDNIYTWGSGTITFTSDTTIQTTWSKGVCKWLDEFTVEANWSIYSHIIRFNSSYTEYVSVRKGDVIYGKGELKTMYTLCELGEKYLVDKTPVYGIHSYTPKYHALLNERRNNIGLFLEIGIGNYRLMSRVVKSSDYIPGASLRMWRDYCPKAQIVGCDIDESTLFTDERITTIKTDQSNVDSLNQLIENVKKIQPYADVILDDGSHIEEHMVTSFKTLWKLVKPGGLYIIEDIHISRIDNFANLHKDLGFTNVESVFVHKGTMKHTEDNFVVFVKSEPILFDNRNDMLLHYCKVIDKPKILEIGIFKGEFFDFIVNNCSLGSIEGVDLFDGAAASGDQDGNNVIWHNLAQSFTDLTEKYKDVSNVNLYRSDSSTYLESKEDSTYDIIYIDGDHDYEGCKKDLEASFKKIKHGGYIMGHDYGTNFAKTKTIWYFGVEKAVNEFCDTHNQSILAKAMDGCVGFCIKVNKFNNYVWNLVQPYTWLSPERINNNIQCVNEVLKNKIPGDIIEIGVCKGGSIMSMLMTLNANGEKRHVRLYDTFEGMTPATEHDVQLYNEAHYNIVVKHIPDIACDVSLDTVKTNVGKISYWSDYIHYHVGDIMKTTEFPKAIALLRLDTDFYDSTKFELDNFYPFVSSGGIIIIDDYGHWRGARKATDEFLADKPDIKLIPIDYTGVYFYKP